MLVNVVKGEILLVYFDELYEVVAIKKFALYLHFTLFLLQKFDGLKCLNVLNLN